MKYGDQICLENGYNDFKGGFLDTNGHSTSGKYSVTTATTATRGQGTGTWQVESASGKATGTPVTSGDLVHLRNLYSGDGGYLDTNGHADNDQKQTGGLYDVNTNASKTRAPGTGSWRVFAQTSNPADRSIRIGDCVLLFNAYDGNGGFLETNGHASASGAVYEVCTNAYFNRSSDVAYWKIHKA
ncbi:hypothetical protein [Pilimelia columellifera]|uniref:Uncharacterized protein n=1 Tax=Pilimelia columellifera subsp. columellifera TaxID=706583 RepID=A0ABN3N567_9ACTN